jgi:hypothetical protein
VNHVTLPRAATLPCYPSVNNAVGNPYRKTYTNYSVLLLCLDIDTSIRRHDIDMSIRDIGTSIHDIDTSIHDIDRWCHNKAVFDVNNRGVVWTGSRRVRYQIP